MSVHNWYIGAPSFDTVAHEFNPTHETRAASKRQTYDGIRVFNEWYNIMPPEKKRRIHDQDRIATLRRRGIDAEDILDWFEDAIMTGRNPLDIDPTYERQVQETFSVIANIRFIFQNNIINEEQCDELYHIVLECRENLEMERLRWHKDISQKLVILDEVFTLLLRFHLNTDKVGEYLDHLVSPQFSLDDLLEIILNEIQGYPNDFDMDYSLEKMAEEAASYNMASALRLIVQSGRLDELDEQALFDACRLNYVDVVRVLLDTSLRVHLEPTFHAFYWAVECESYDVVEFFLEDGRVDPSQQGNRAYRYARHRWGKTNDIVLLLEEDPRVRAKMTRRDDDSDDDDEDMPMRDINDAFDDSM